MAGMLLPIKTDKSLKCERCTMRYKAKLCDCPHCKDIPDGEALDRHIRKHRARLRANKSLGLAFLVMACAFAVLLAVVFV